MTKFNIYMKKTSINSISLFVVPVGNPAPAGCNFLGDILASNSHEAMNNAWLRLLGKF